MPELLMRWSARLGPVAALIAAGCSLQGTGLGGAADAEGHSAGGGNGGGGRAGASIDRDAAARGGATPVGDADVAPVDRPVPVDIPPPPFDRPADLPVAVDSTATPDVRPPMPDRFPDLLPPDVAPDAMLLPAGAACVTQGNCASGSCVDNVCCETPCAGACQACVMGKTGAPSGLCRPVPAGQDPDAECEAEVATTCGRNGVCDGGGGCQLYRAGTPCSQPVCTGNLLVPGRQCTGQGACGDVPAARACAGGLVCENAIVCKTRCQSSVDCAAGFVCDPNEGACRPKRPVGSVCVAAMLGAECLSGFCVDGVCCDSACSGTCRACTASSTGQPDGKCAPALAGADPDDECVAQDAVTCGQDGVCDGAGACRKHADGTVCGSFCCLAMGTDKRCALACEAGVCRRNTGLIETCTDGIDCTNPVCVDMPAEKKSICTHPSNCGFGRCCCPDRQAQGGGRCVYGPGQCVGSATCVP